jgi:prepilin-type processing-associated H-X9-DG protein
MNFRVLASHNFKRSFSLVELLVIISILLILISLLQPSLKNALEYGQSIACKSNLQKMGAVTNLYMEDHNDYIPHSHFTSDFDDNNDGIRSTAEAMAHGYAINGFSEAYGWWYSKYSIGQYMFEVEPQYDWQYVRNEAYVCPSRTFDNPLNKKPQCYGVSSTLWKQVYPHNRQPNPDPKAYWARAGSFSRPHEMLSIADLRQGEWGDAYQPYVDFIQGSGEVVGFNRSSASPANGNNAVPMILPAEQNGEPVNYGVNPVLVQRGVDFRHRGESFNASFLDGHVCSVPHYHRNLDQIIQHKKSQILRMIITLSS